KEPVEIIASTEQPKNSLVFIVANNTAQTISAKVKTDRVAEPFSQRVSIPAFSSEKMNVPSGSVLPGSNTVTVTWKDVTTLHTVKQNIINWNIDKNPMEKMKPIFIDQYFNDKVTNIFKNQYLSPRPATVTLQLPIQGIGEWTHPMLTATIDDSGLRGKAANNNIVTLPQGVSFRTPSEIDKPNILFTSQWDNYPREAMIPLSGKASHAYLLMAGSTNPMQSRMTNGALIIIYTDGTNDTLLLKNPQSWWPIEQDYYDDGYAFSIGAVKPVRIHLKTGNIISALDDTIKKYNGKMIEGGSATVLDMPLQNDKTLKQLVLQAWCNDVVIGLMGVTLLY
ncbi:MAG: glycogen debranching protein, partial [Sediminibacterium sp.]